MEPLTESVEAAGGPFNGRDGEQVSERRSDAHFSGNAGSLGALFRGWFVGPYQVSAQEILARPAVEMKWGSHLKGEARQGWDAGSTSWSLSVLVSGSFDILFEDGTEELRMPGDLVIWRPHTPHSWIAIADAVVLTVRWSEDGYSSDASGTYT
jgi:hypothetical protein